MMNRDEDFTVIDNEAKEGEYAENIKRFEVSKDKCKVMAVFWNKEQAKAYAEDFFKVSNGAGCLHFTKYFVDFTYFPESNRISAYSTYANANEMMKMFNNK